MNPTLTDLLLLALAAGAVLDAWFSGSILEPARRRVAMAQQSNNRLFVRLLACPFCLSYHVPYLIVLALVGASLLPGLLGELVRGVMLCLAATRLVVLINDNSMRPYDPIAPAEPEETTLDD